MNIEDLKRELTARRTVLQQTVQHAQAAALLAEDRARLARAELAAEQGALDELTRTIVHLERGQAPAGAGAP